MKATVEFRIYVGTYAKYNKGSIFGSWLDLSDYADSEEFLEACLQLHQDESDHQGQGPELMFQDWEGIPQFLISESTLSPLCFQYLDIVSDMNQQRAEAFEIYCAQITGWSGQNDLDEQLQNFDECYQGYFAGSMTDPELEYAYEYVDQTGL
ncbi:antirestriction protein ArdA, partial [Dyadobacter sp. CY312]|uniref:antirestriction protein ArdA n=1 Tax=Dyadobacter sp. CY312 TaxID=2907303 RepID=UPI001F33FF50